MTPQFTWISFYKELAEELLNWENRQNILIDFLSDLRDQRLPITPLMDKDEKGNSIPLKEIDPFTFFGVFNRKIRTDQRVKILGQIKIHFNLQSPVPSDFSGIPLLMNLRSWFFSNQKYRKEDDVPKLWKVFRLALSKSPLGNTEFLKAFDDALAVRNVSYNLTMGLFWIRPDTFLNLDQVNREYLNIKLPKGGITSEFYADTLHSIAAKGMPFVEISKNAFEAQGEGDEETPTKENQTETDEDISYWLVGAYWDDRDPADQTERFLAEGIWENGYTDRYIDKVKSMQVGDKIGIKATATRRKDLPFDNRGNTVSQMIIKARGTVVANRGDGRALEVEWDSDFQQKSWYFFTFIKTVWELRTDSDYKFEEYSKKLIDFIWRDKEQDYEWFCERWWGNGKPDGEPKPYSVDDIIAEGVFLEDHEIRDILNRLRSKKALILQGAPGVGKTFVAKKIAYALIEQVDSECLEMVQFHQTYSYDDFVRGYRPDPFQANSFKLQDGVFFEFCQKAIQDPERPYVFIIDEINRGNLSLIFGELLMLIEGDKRGPGFAVPLVYRKEGESRFHIPINLYLIGLMNIADRSLAMVDYALRRRFAFYTLLPKYESGMFRKWLSDRSMPDDLVQLIIARMAALNSQIKEDTLLGENYQVGHSYFCPKGDNFAELNVRWYRSIVETEIAPLLKEYWFDNPQKSDEAIKQLLNQI